MLHPINANSLVRDLLLAVGMLAVVACAGPTTPQGEDMSAEMAPPANSDDDDTADTDDEDTAEDDDYDTGEDDDDTAEDDDDIDDDDSDDDDDDIDDDDSDDDDDDDSDNSDDDDDDDTDDDDDDDDDTGHDDDTGDDDDDSDDDGMLSLTMDPPMPAAGQPLTISITGALPNQQVFLLTSQSSGAGPCPSVLDGLCLDLQRPRLLGDLRADGNGELVLSGPLPGSVNNLWLQAATMQTAAVSNAMLLGST